MHPTGQSGKRRGAPTIESATITQWMFTAECVGMFGDDDAVRAPRSRCGWRVVDTFKKTSALKGSDRTNRRMPQMEEDGDARRDRENGRPEEISQKMGRDRSRSRERVKRRSRSRSTERRRERSRSKDRERKEPRKYREEKRSRSRSPRDKKEARRDRSRSKERRERDRERQRKEKKEKKQEKQEEISLESVQSVDDEAMMAMMGFGGFDTTKNKQVSDNVDGCVNIKKPRRYRQYMNRKGGFNRPLDFMG